MSAAEADLARVLIVWISASVAGTAGGVLFVVLARAAECHWLLQVAGGCLVGAGIGALVAWPS